MDAVIDYAKVPDTIQPYAKAQYYAKAMGENFWPKGYQTHSDMCRCGGYTINLRGSLWLEDKQWRNFNAGWNFYILKAFIIEEIYIGKLPKVFQDSHREKNMGLSINTDEKNKNCRDKNLNHRTLKSDVTKADTKSEEADDSKTVFSDLTFTVADGPD